MSRDNRVVITGLGVVSPIGFGADAYWRQLRDGVCGLAPIQSFDTTGHKVKLAGEIKDFKPEDFMDKKEARRSDRYCQFAMAAARMAIEDAGLDLDTVDKDRAGTLIGSGIGGILTLEAEHAKLLEKGPGRVSPFFVPMMIANMAAGMVSIYTGFRGLSMCPVTACATGNNAIGEAFSAIVRGEMDICIAGGAEAAITPLAIAGFANMTAMSEADDPALGILPFDGRRSGFLMGEGAGIVVLESYAHAVRRGATVYCELAGYGLTSDAYHITGPNPDGIGAARAMTRAMEQAGLAPVDIDYINAHGTGTPLNDKIETRAIHAALGQQAQHVAVSSTKSMTGHLLGAAGGVEAVAVVMAIKDGILPPTIHLQSPDPECDLDYVPLVAREKKVRAALSNSMGFGGHNASLLMKEAK